MWSNPQEIADLVTFTEEILDGKLHFLCMQWEAFITFVTHERPELLSYRNQFIDLLYKLINWFLNDSSFCYLMRL